MKAGDYVRIQKLGATLYGLPPCPLPYYSPGAYKGYLSLPVSYWMDGFLLRPIQIRDQICLDRRVRMGIVTRGEFFSSRIVRIRGDLVITRNSVWQVRRVPELRSMEDAT
jgi:hypothetical protein